MMAALRNEQKHYSNFSPALRITALRMQEEKSKFSWSGASAMSRPYSLRIAW